MLSLNNIFDTINMIDKQHLDIRTITMGISLLDCVSEDPKRCCDKIYDKITKYAENLVKTGEDIESEFGIPIVHKRISVTPMALVAGSCDTEDLVPFALTMDRAARFGSLRMRCMTLRRCVPPCCRTTPLWCSSIPTQRDFPRPSCSIYSAAPCRRCSAAG